MPAESRLLAAVDAVGGMLGAGLQSGVRLEVAMDRPDGLDPERYCSFCQETFPEIGELFAAPDGLSICDGCVQFLWETLQAQCEAEEARAADAKPIE